MGTQPISAFCFESESWICLPLVALSIKLAAAGGFQAVDLMALS